MFHFYVHSQFSGSACLWMPGGEATAPASRLFRHSWTQEPGAVLPQRGRQAAEPGGSDGRALVSLQNMDGCEEGVEFLPANNSRKVEKGGPRRWVVLVAVLAAFLALSLLAGLLAWHFQGE